LWLLLNKHLRQPLYEDAPTSMFVVADFCCKLLFGVKLMTRPVTVWCHDRLHWFMTAGWTVSHPKSRWSTYTRATIDVKHHREAIYYSCHRSTDTYVPNHHIIKQGIGPTVLAWRRIRHRDLQRSGFAHLKLVTVLHVDIASRPCQLLSACPAYRRKKTFHISPKNPLSNLPRDRYGATKSFSVER